MINRRNKPQAIADRVQEISKKMEWYDAFAKVDDEWLSKALDHHPIEKSPFRLRDWVMFKGLDNSKPIRWSEDKGGWVN